MAQLAATLLIAVGAMSLRDTNRELEQTFSRYRAEQALRERGLRVSIYAKELASAQEAIQKRDMKGARSILMATASDLRSWEWAHLVHLANQQEEKKGATNPGAPDTAPRSPAEPLTIKIDDPGRAVGGAFNADGTLFASNHSGREFRIWDTKTWKQSTTLRCSADYDRLLLGIPVFTPDSKRVVTLRDGLMPALFDVASGNEANSSIPPMFGTYTRSAVSSDGRWIATECQTNDQKAAPQPWTLQLHDASKGSEVWRTQRPERFNPEWIRRAAQVRERNRSLRFSPAGDWLVDSWGGETWVWRSDSGQLIGKKPIPKVRIHSISDSSSRMLTVHYDDVVRLWDLKSGAQLSESALPTAQIISACLSPDAARVAFLSRDVNYKVHFSLIDPQTWKTTDQHDVGWTASNEEEQHDILYSSDGRLITVCVNYQNYPGRGGLLLWDVETRRPLERLDALGPHHALVQSARKLVFNRARYSGGPLEEVVLVETATKNSASLRSPDQAPQLLFACSPNDLQVVTLDELSLSAWSTDNGKLLSWRYLECGSPVRAIAFTPDGSSLAAIHQPEAYQSNAALVSLWDCSSGRQAAAWTKWEVKAGATLSKDGRFRFNRANQPWTYGESRHSFSENDEFYVSFADKSLLHLYRFDNPAPDSLSALHEAPPLKTYSFPGVAFCAAVSPHGKWVVGGGVLGGKGKHRYDSVTGGVGGLVVWSRSNDGIAARLECGADRTVVHVAVSFDESLVASFDVPRNSRGISESETGVLRVWSVATARQLMATETMRPNVFDLVWSPNCESIATWHGRSNPEAEPAGGVRVWAVPSGALTLALDNYDLACVRFTTDGKRLAANAWEGPVRIFDALSGQELISLGAHSKSARGLEFSPDGQRLAVADSKRQTNNRSEIRIWDSAIGGESKRMNSHSLPVQLVAFSEDSQFAISVGKLGGKPSEVLVWEIENARMRCSLESSGLPVETVAISAGGRIAATTHRLSKGPSLIQLWDGATGKRLHACEGHALDAATLKFSPDGRFLAGAGRREKVEGSNLPTGNVVLWEVATGKLVRAYDEASVKYVSDIAFAADGQHLAILFHEEGSLKLMVLEIGSGTVQFTIELGQHQVRASVQYDASGREIHVRRGGPIERYDAASGEFVKEALPIELPVWAWSGDRVARSNDGQFALARRNSRGYGIEFGSLGGSTRFSAPNAHLGEVWWMDFSPDQRWVLTAGDDRTLLLWDCRKLLEKFGRPVPPR